MTAALLLFSLSFLRDGWAVPSFGRQTGLSCESCHTVFPELTPVGRSFKLEGYVQSKSTSRFEYPPPLGAGAKFSFTNGNGLSARINPYDDSPEAKFNLPEQGSLYYAGRIWGPFGGYAQLSYDGVSNNLFLDNTDLRYANHTFLKDKDLTFGVTLNNNPSVQDVWNTTPAFRFPYATSSVAYTQKARTIIEGTLAHQVGGIGLYALWSDTIYGEVTAYLTNNQGITRPLGAGTDVTTVVDDAAPYWRLVFQQQWSKHSFSVGHYGLLARIFPAGQTSGATDLIVDMGLDGQYQYIGPKHIFTVQATWIWEKQDWDASYPLGKTSNAKDNLETFRVNLNYYYRSGTKWGTVGGTASYFTYWGSQDGRLYPPEPFTGSRTGSPNSDGFILEADYLPIDRMRISAQYITYIKVNGERSNFDGFGRNAPCDNTFYLLLWLVL